MREPLPPIKNQGFVNYLFLTGSLEPVIYPTENYSSFVGSAVARDLLDGTEAVFQSLRLNNVV